MSCVFCNRLTRCDCAVEGAVSGALQRCPPHGAYLGISTVSMAWITPLSAATSAATTYASFTIAPPMVLIITSLPSTVFTLPAFRSVEMTLPATTW